MKSISVSPIGVVHSTRKKLEDDNWDAEKASVELDSSQFSEEALLGFPNFLMSRLFSIWTEWTRPKWKTARHSRNNFKWPKVGIFANVGKIVQTKLEPRFARS